MDFSEFYAPEILPRTLQTLSLDPLGVFLRSCSGRLWHRQPADCAGRDWAEAVRVGAQEAARQEGRLQHRGAAGCGRLGGALPRQGACAELRPHAHEHSKSCGPLWQLSHSHSHGLMAPRATRPTVLWKDFDESKTGKW